jgi:DNA-directed RNA polymerase subunit beta'
VGKINLEKIRISLASPEAIKKWSYGEVKKPETINYRTLKPEKDGLFCEKIFGPVKDWECHCGKYKRIRYKNIKCEACGVEVTQTKVRRERMGHIVLAAPVSHIWYFKGTPSRMSYLLGISVKELERVLYYGDYMVTKVEKDEIDGLVKRIKSEKPQFDIKKLMPTFSENTARLEMIEDGKTGKKYPVISNMKVCDGDFSRDAREEIQSTLKRLQSRFAEDSGVTFKVEKGSDGVASIRVYRRLGDEEKVIGYLPQVYSKYIIPIIADPSNEYEVFVERITKGFLDRRRLGIRVGLRFKDKAITQALMRSLNTRFQECEDVYSAIYIDEGIALLQSLEPKQTLQTGMLGNVYKFSDGRMFKAEDRIFEEIYELDFYVPRPFDKLRGLIKYLAECFNDTSINNVFHVDMGAPAVKTVLAGLDLDELGKELREDIIKSKKQKRMKLIKRLTVVEAFRRSKNKPEWMILDLVPVLPPDLRPMVQLEGGRFASSDLNDLYRRVINRNNRLKKLIEIKAPESIIRNEKRMLQEAVDALIDNGRRGRVFTGSHKRPLKSLSELLKGKQGRFRQNLLGKRVDYSGRSVIVVGPELKLHQCGLPKDMALELFKPFVMHELVLRNIVPNIKSAKKIVERADNEVWDVLEEIVKDHPVLLNRAPTLHRLGIQAFQPTLIEGKAIQIHPLVCAAFNADFDGDQMAVHLPLSVEAQAEARLIMLSTNNLLLPANGRPIVAPTQDIVIGIYYLTLEKKGAKGEGKLFRDMDELKKAYDLGFVSIHAKVRARYNGKIVNSTVGRFIFNSVLPKGMPFQDMSFDKKTISKMIAKTLRRYGQLTTVKLLDAIKELGFRFATRSGLTISIHDVAIPPARAGILKEGDKIEKQIDDYYDRGLLTEDERYQKRVDLWMERTEKIAQEFGDAFEKDKFNSLFMMAKSGARGTLQQIRQLAGLRGLMTDPTGRIIDFPIKTNFREGLSVLEYFISTHGARKGLADTALRTADSGYLTRRLVDVAQDSIIQELECGTNRYLNVESAYVNGMDTPIVKEIALKDLKLTKKKPVEIKEPKVYPFENIQNEFATIKMKGKHKKVSLKKIYAIRDEHRQVIGAKKEGKVQLLDMIGIDLPGLVKSGSPIVELLGEKLIGRIAGRDIFSLTTGEVFVKKGEEVLEEDFDNIKKTIISAPLQIRSVLECQTRYGVCAKCYGRNFATGKLTQIGDAIGIIAAQSIGEPGTQLTMRTFHTGGVSGEDISDITQGLPRVEELFEARKPKFQSIMSEVDGKVEMENRETGRELVLTPAPSKEGGSKKIRYKVPEDVRVIVKSADRVTMGQALTEGHLNPHEILSVMGISKAQQYIVNEVISVYKSQGVDTNEKHVEVIVREMLRKIRIEGPGDTDLLPQSLVDRFEFDRVNRDSRLRGKKPATGRAILLGITKCSLSTHSFLSAASFQETTRVLTDAAVKGKIDPLMGLKENVIIGNLIPAGTGLPSYRELKLKVNVPEGMEFGEAMPAEVRNQIEPLTKEALDADGFFQEDEEEKVLDID